ncbi:hypothetical protein M231_04935 [Tremella mesenterica]|uniref:mRNA export factor MEX67 n=1 Tax=Tremella mesenterica TaxID=5217 RepID=A0A4Q1BJA1_TREME|nr:hypothetical protein M231_04935 [Tremella mesenterica]
MLTPNDPFRPSSPLAPSTSHVRRRRRPDIPLHARIITFDSSMLPVLQSAPSNQIRHYVVQSGRHRGPASATPYDRPRHDGQISPSTSNLAARISGPDRTSKKELLPKRPKSGMPIFATARSSERREKMKVQHARLNAVLGGEEIKQWLRSRMISEGVLDMSGLPQDEWLKKNDILPPSHRDAPTTAGVVLWKLVDQVIQKTGGIQIHTLSLARNEFVNFQQLIRLPHSLPHIRAIDFSDNPINSFHELSLLAGPGDSKGKALNSHGSLKALVELKFNGCLFREAALKEEGGGEKYQSEILRRFPGLLILDGIQLNRIVFPITRKPRVSRKREALEQLRARPFTFPVDIQAGFAENEIAKNIAMAFCAKFFPLWDTSRALLIDGYSPNATISISVNTIGSFSALADDVRATRATRPPSSSYDRWSNLPSRNLFRGKSARTADALKSPADREGLLKWWNDNVPQTRHPLEDASKWNVDAWVLDGEGVTTRLCAMITGEFQELPSMAYRTFSRTVILVDAPEGSMARNSGWPASILSDTLIVHPYFGTASFDTTCSLAKDGITISPPSSLPSVTPSPINAEQQKEVLITQLRQRTGMNVTFSTLCLEQNGWDLEIAYKNFEEIRSNIPPEAYV